MKRNKVYCNHCRYRKCEEWGGPYCKAFITYYSTPLSMYQTIGECEAINSNNDCSAWEEKMTMSKAFFGAVERLREHIMGGYLTRSHRELDKIVQIVTEEEQAMGQELTLQEDVARIIKRIKAAKENEALEKKADEVIAKLKEEL